jgi:uncharacterized protein (UPF0333 family)
MNQVKMAALLLFVAVVVALSAWAIVDAFNQSGSTRALGPDFQASVIEATAEATATEWIPSGTSIPEEEDMFFND